MATFVKEENKEIDVTTCPLCSGNLRAPKQLECLHNFCESCLQAYIFSNVSDANSGKFTCPVCHLPNRVPVPGTDVKGWARQMPNNSLVMSLAAGVPLNSQSHICTPCKREGKSSAAYHWCRNCFEPLCKFCKGIHRKIKQIAEHIIIPLEEVKHVPQKQRMLETKSEEPCADHPGRNIEMYCHQHKKLCCVVCFATNHRDCVNINPIEELAAEKEDTGEIAEIVDAIEDVAQRSEEQVAYKTQTLAFLNNKNIELTERIEEVTSRAIKRLEALRDESIATLNKHHSQETQKVQNLKRTIESTRTAVDLNRKYLEAISKYGSPCQLFVTSEKVKEQIGFHNEILATDRECSEDLDYKFEFSKEFVELTETMTSIGTFKIIRTLSEPDNKNEFGDLEYAEYKIPDNRPYKPRPRNVTFNLRQPQPPQLQPPPSETIETTDAFSLKLIKEKDYNGAAARERRIVWFTSGTFLDDNIHFVLADYNNRKLKKFKRDYYHPVMVYTLASAPSDVALVREDEILVTLPHTCRISRYRLENDDMTQIHEITTKSAPEGIAYVNNKIIAAFGECIKILEEDGEEVISIPTEESLTYTAPVVASKRSKRFYHRDGKSLVCRTLDGTEVFRYQNRELREPGGIALDCNDNLYVCDCKCGNLYQISSDGSRGRIIRSSRVCVGTPVGIGFDRAGKRLWLTSKVRRSGQFLTIYRLSC